MRQLLTVFLLSMCSFVAYATEPSNHDSTTWSIKGKLIYGSGNDSNATNTLSATITFITASGLEIPAVEGRMLLRFDEYRFLLGPQEVTQLIVAVDRFLELARAHAKQPFKAQKRLASVETLSRTADTGGRRDLITLTITTHGRGNRTQPSLRLHLSSWVDEYLAQSGVFYTGIDYSERDAQSLRQMLLRIRSTLAKPAAQKATTAQART